MLHSFFQSYMAQLGISQMYSGTIQTLPHLEKSGTAMSYEMPQLGQGKNNSKVVRKKVFLASLKNLRSTCSVPLRLFPPVHLYLTLKEHSLVHENKRADTFCSFSTQNYNFYEAKFFPPYYG